MKLFTCEVQSSFCCSTFHIIETEENKLREASLAASSRLKRALLKEKEAKDSLQKVLNETQVCVAMFLVCLSGLVIFYFWFVVFFGILNLSSNYDEHAL